MKNTFSVSLYKNGLLGGWIIVDEESMVYKTGKVTVSSKYRNLEMAYKDILSITEEKLLFLPIIAIKLKNNEEYKFLVFNKNRFLEIVNEKKG